MTRTTGIVRLLDPLGRVVIPKETRELLGIREEDTLEFFVEGESLMLRKYRTTCCMFCLSADDLIYFKNHFVCRTCGKEAVNGGAVPARKDPPAVTRLQEDPSKLRVRRRRQEDLLAELMSTLEQSPDLKQKQLAERLGVSQGRVSQLMKLIHTR